MTGFWFIVCTTTLYLLASVAFATEGKWALSWIHLFYALANFGVLWLAARPPN